MSKEMIYRDDAIDAVNSHKYIYENKHLNDYEQGWNDACDYCADEWLDDLPPTQSDIAEKLYLYKCYITDKEGLQHEVIHTGDIRRVTGWEI